MSTRYTGGLITKNPQPLNPLAGNAANGVFTMDQYTQAVQNGTWPAYDPYFDQTTLLLHGNGTNGTQNNTFLDSSTNNFTITRNGNTTQGTFSPFSRPAGKWGAYFNGTSDYLTLPDNAAFAWGSGDLTVEGWFFHTGKFQNYGFGDAYGFLWAQTVSGSNYFVIDLNSPSNRIISLMYNAGVGGTLNGPAWEPNRWNHFAVVKSSGVITIYLNGVPGVSAALATNWTVSYVPTISRYTHASGWFVNMYCSNWRAVKGTAVYTGPFTPPTEPLTAIPNTSALLFQDNRFKDNSANNFTVTPIGPEISTFSFFQPQSVYSPTVNGGSGYFDGSGDYLSATLTSNAPGTGAFTYECWIYPTLTQQFGIMNTRSGDTSDGFDWSVATNGTSSCSYTSLGFLASSAGAVKANEWTHMAVVRSGTTMTLYINGVSSATSTRGDNFTSTTFNIGVTALAGNPALGYITNFRYTREAVYTGNFTPPTAPPSPIANTSFLCNFTNAGIIDSTMSNNLETVGNAQIDTTIKKFGDGSIECDGTGDYLVLNGNPDNFIFDSNPFTIECWVYFNNTSSIMIFYDGRPSGVGSTTAPTIYMQSGTIRYYVSGADRITSWVINARQWYHVAVARNGTSTKLFIDGVQAGATYADTTVYTNSITRPVIAADGNSFGNNALNGYIDDLRVTKGIARYTSNFAVPYLPTQPLPLNNNPYQANTTLMLPGTGTNGAQNNTFLDSSTNNFTITRNGNTTQGTFTPFSRDPGYWGNYFAGATNNSITAATGSGVAFGTGNFCEEFFCYANSYSANWRIISFQTSSVIELSQSSGAILGVGIAGGGITSTGFTLPTNTWFHIVATRQTSDNIIRVFVDGVLRYNVSNTTNFSTSQSVYIGGFPGFTQSFDGYISNARIIKGNVPLAYQTNSTTNGTTIFTPPSSPLTAVTGTELLTCQSNQFSDTNTQAAPKTITVTGSTARVTTFSPFPYLNQYSPTVNGGSGYFDGSGDYLGLSTQDALPLGTEEFTVEFWLYKNNAWSTNNQYILDDNGTGGFQIWANTSSGVLRLGRSAVAAVLDYAYSNLKILEWTHFAYSRKVNDFALWVNGTRVATTTNTNGFASSHGTQTIGADAAGGNAVNAYLANLRIVQGSYVYDTANATITVPTAPVTAISGTSLLTNFTNAGITDASMTTDLETVGNAQISTAQSRWGGGAIYFDGTGDYLIAPDNINFSFGTGDFTVECWIYLTNLGRTNGIWTNGPASNGSFGMYITSANKLEASVFGGTNATGVTSLTANVWYHVLAARSGSTLRLFLNGVQEASVTNTFNNSTIKCTVGNSWTNQTASPMCYISDLRVIKGIALLPTALQTSQWQDQ